MNKDLLNQGRTPETIIGGYINHIDTFSNTCLAELGGEFRGVFDLLLGGMPCRRFALAQKTHPNCACADHSDVPGLRLKV